jgi:anti-sigma factor RsiW
MDTLNQNMCELLDAFLDEELNAVEMASFEAHLLQCTDCRESVRQQQWIDGALRADEVAAQTAPLSLLAATAEAITDVRRKQRRGMLAGSLVAAASVALLVSWSWRTPTVAPGSAGGSVTMPEDVVQRDATPPRRRGLEEEAPASSKIAATFTASGSGIALPVASDSPDVTIVQFYPTTEADRRLQRQRELEAKYRELIGG